MRISEFTVWTWGSCGAAARRGRCGSAARVSPGPVPSSGLPAGRGGLSGSGRVVWAGASSSSSPAEGRREGGGVYRPLRGAHPHRDRLQPTHAPENTDRDAERWRRGETPLGRGAALASRRGRERRSGKTRRITPTGFVPPLDRSRRKGRCPRRGSMPMWWALSPAPGPRTSPLTARRSRKAPRSWSGKCPPPDRSGARWASSSGASTLMVMVCVDGGRHTLSCCWGVPEQGTDSLCLLSCCPSHTWRLLLTSHSSQYKHNFIKKSHENRLYWTCVREKKGKLPQTCCFQWVYIYLWNRLNQVKVQINESCKQID